MTTTTTLPIFDGHNDALLQLYLPVRGSGRSFFDHSERGHVDLPRARAGGLAGGFFAIFVPRESALHSGQGMPDDLTITATGYEVRLASAIEQAYAQRVTNDMMAILFRLEAESQGQLTVARTTADLTAAMSRGALAAVLHFEGAEAIDPELEALEVFYAAGLRSLGITWSRPNAFGHGVPFKYPSSPDTGPGLTDAGHNLVRACNRLGILLDLAHLNERGFWDVAALSTAPLVVTHACVHTICPVARNLTDRQLDAIGESDGVVGVAFDVSMLRPDGGRDPDMPLEVLVRHIAYIAERIGIDNVALGSDFDGATMPHALADVSKLPALVAALRAHGFDDPALRKLTHENWLRVLAKTWRA